MIKKYKLSNNFEFSQNYLFFWDKFEKSYYFLQAMVDLRDRELKDEIVRFFLKEPQEDGGDWHMFIDLVEKYGLLPQNNMMDSYQSEKSSKLNTYLNRRLRDYVYHIRQFDLNYPEDKIEKFLSNCMIEIYRLLVIFLGEPPRKFIWERYQKKKHPKL